MSDTSLIALPSALARRVGVTDHELAEHLCMALAATAWLLVLTPASGGLHDARTALFAACLMPAILAVRPWAYLPLGLVIAVPMAAAGAVLTLVVTTTGWQQADSPASQVAGLLTLPLVAAYARSENRRRAVVGVLLTAVALQAWPAWFAWWGSHDPNHLMVGTFFWHNQVGTWMAALGIVGAVSAVRGSGASRALAVLLAGVAGAVVVLSTSRASLGLWLLTLALLPLIALRVSSQRARALATALAVPFVVVGLLMLLTSSLFFPDKRWDGLPILGGSASAEQATPTGPAAITGDRGVGSAASNGSDRFEWTRAALEAWATSPLVGHGFGSFEETSDVRLPETTGRSVWVHDGPAEALTSGGILFGGPIIAICAMLGLSALRVVRRAVTTTDESAGNRVGPALATLVLLAHTLVDFDWHYSSLVVLLGVTGGLVIASGETRQARHPALLAAALIAAAGFAAVATLVERAG